MHSRRGKSGVLYFMGCQHLLKIGFTRNLQQRLADFRLGNPFIELRAYRSVPAALDRQVEQLVHTALADRRHGGEWFDVDLKTALAAAQPLVARAHREYRRMERDVARFDAAYAYAFGTG